MLNPVLEAEFGASKEVLLSYFLPRYQHKVNISKLEKDFQIVLPYTASTTDKKLVFVKNSKVACTSIAHLLYEYSYNKKFQGNIHRDGLNFHHGIYWWQENHQLLTSSNATIFSVVRDPKARCLSAFKNFFIDQNNKSAKKHLKSMAEFGYHVNSKIEKNFDIFLDYIEASNQIDPYRVDRHWRAQHINLGIGTIDYSYIGKIENLLADMKVVFKLAGIDASWVEQLNKKHNSTQKNDFDVSSQQLARIKLLYKKDYEFFNYE